MCENIAVLVMHPSEASFTPSALWIGKKLSDSSAAFFSDVLSITGIDACFLLVKLIS